TAALLLGTSSFSAQAADPASVMVAADVMQGVADTLGMQGWYLRGDVGYSDTNAVKMQVTRAGVPDDYLSAKLAKRPVMTAGVGGYFNNWLRADVTLSYRDNAALRGIYSSAVAGRDPNVGREETSAKVSNLAALFNVYADLGTWSGFTPYIGAGIGVSRNKFSNYAGTYYIGPAHPAYGTVCAGGPWVAPAVETCPSPSQIGNGTRTELAYALMAGTAIEISPALKIDLGYRFMHYGKTRSGADAVALAGVPPTTITIGTKDLNAHEFRFGLRYMFR
ncbi:MAG: outer membrane protein, partial [Beijerinckiaceae bacterium]